MAVDYLPKIADGSATVSDVFKAVLARNLTDSNKTQITRLFKQLPEEGIDLDARYFDVYDSKEFMEAFSYLTNRSGTHRYKEFGAFETQLESVIRLSKRNERYVRLSDANKKKGIATDAGLVGTQLRGKDPMRGTIFSEQLDKVYNDALLKPSVTKTDTKLGQDFEKAIDPEARDYLIYEKYTGQRAESNIGPDGLKVSDFNFFTDENGNVAVEVMSKKVGNKTRPEVTYRGEFAEFLRSKVERAKSNLPENADFSKVNLFQTTPTAVTNLWNTTIRPELEKKFGSSLPASKGGSHSTIRKILARQLVQEFQFPRDAVKAWMGHAGAGVDSSGDILSENYIGNVSDNRIGEMSNILIRNDARNSKVSSVNMLFINRGVNFSGETSFAVPTKKVMGKNIDLSSSQANTQPLTDEQKKEQDAVARRNASAADLVTEENTQRLSQLQSERRTAPDVQKPTIATPVVSEETKKLFEERGILHLLGDLGKKVLPVGLVGAGILADTEAFATDVAIEAAALASKVPAGPAGALPMIVAPKEVGAGELQPDDRPATQEESVQAAVDRGSMTSEEGIQFNADNDPQIQQEIMEQEAMRDASFLNIDRGPEANSVNQDQGFLSR